MYQYCCFPGMKSNVTQYIKSCSKCAQHNPKLPNDAPPLNSIPVPSRVWSMLGIELFLYAFDIILRKK